VESQLKYTIASSINSALSITWLSSA